LKNNKNLRIDLTKQFSQLFCIYSTVKFGKESGRYVVLGVPVSMEYMNMALPGLLRRRDRELILHPAALVIETFSYFLLQQFLLQDL